MLWFWLLETVATTIKCSLQELKIETFFFVSKKKGLLPPFLLYRSFAYLNQNNDGVISGTDSFFHWWVSTSFEIQGEP